MRAAPVRLFARIAVVLGAGVLAACGAGRGLVAPAWNPPPIDRPFDHALSVADGAPGVVRAGAAVVDVTPYRSRGVFIAGYGPGRPAARIGGRITARVLYLEAGGMPLVIAGVDVVGLLAPTVNAIRDRVTARFADRIIISSTHNHQGPDTIGLWGDAMFGVPMRSGVDPAYTARLEREIAAAIVAAQAAAEPAVLVAAEGVVPPGVSANFWWRDYKDDTLTALEARSVATGRPIGTLVSYALHAEVLGPENRDLHPDFPGVFYDVLQQMRGGTAIFVPGAVGGMVIPTVNRTDEGATLTERRRIMTLTGEAIAAVANDALATAEPVTGPMVVQARAVAVPVTNRRFLTLAKWGVLPAVARESENGPVLDSSVTYVRIGDGFTLAAVPGEIFPSVGFHIRDRLLEGRFRMIVGLANDQTGYLMLPDEYAGGLYPYETTMGPGPDGAKVVLEALAALVGKPDEPLPSAPVIENGRVVGFRPRNADLPPVLRPPGFDADMRRP